MTDKKIIVYYGGKGIGKSTYVKSVLMGKKWVDLRTINASEFISFKGYVGVVDVYDRESSLTNYRVFDAERSLTNVLDFFDKGGDKVIIVTHDMGLFKPLFSSYPYEVIELDLRYLVDEVLGNSFESTVKESLKGFSYGYTVGAKYLKLLGRKVEFERPEDIIAEYLRSLNLDELKVKIRGKLGVLPKSVIGDNVLSERLELLFEEVLENYAKDLDEVQALSKLQDILLGFNEECLRQAFLVSVTVSKAGYLCERCPDLCVRGELPLSVRQAVLYPRRITLRMPFRGCGDSVDDIIRYGSSDEGKVCTEKVLRSIHKYATGEFPAQVLHEYLGKFYAERAEDKEELRALGVYVRVMSVYLKDRMSEYAKKIIDKGDWIAKSLILPYLVDSLQDTKPVISSICSEGIEECKVALIDGGIDELNARYDRDLDIGIRSALSNPPKLVPEYCKYLGVEPDKWLTIRKEYYESTIGKFLVYAGLPDEAQKHLIHCVNSEITETMINCRILWAKTMVQKGQDISEYSKELWNEVKNKVDVVPQTKAIALALYVVSNDDRVAYEAYSYLLRYVPYVKIMVDCYFGNCDLTKFALITVHKGTVVPALRYKLGEITREEAFDECIESEDITECDDYVMNPDEAVRDVLERTVQGRILLTERITKKDLIIFI
ncbi:hypothetical protein [Stygiolobus caldivivus]|uniref:Uncharacterized protein n=1 Tax=Stygiolobus caldivivus TaxID=2824673 RepID=A0A8D5ZJN0_9CREN|nr:hypothetical protein [Stygiolobus caldivivus]BCU70352.1 hypothetical protein KN1_16490 [Stygiolobus caldivivus]